MKLIEYISTNSAESIMYVYAYSWTPGFCYNQVNNYPGCAEPQDYWKNNFTIHGLWPQYADSTGYPSYCSSEVFDPNIPLNIGWDTMTEKWPDVQYDENSADYDSFWEHEWTKHGTCSNLSQQDYFESALNLTEDLLTPTVLQNAIGQSINADVLRDALGGYGYVSLQCTISDNGNDDILTGAYTCWLQNNGYPTNQVMCPDEVINEDTCTSENITVLSL